MEIDDILEEDLLDIFSGFEVKKTNNDDGNSDKKTKNNVSKDIEIVEENFEELFNENRMQKETKSKVLEIDSDNVENFSLLLKELLNNKTIEITIKIKEN